jgi:hypothetical protein
MRSPAAHSDAKSQTTFARAHQSHIRGLSDHGCRCVNVFAKPDDAPISVLLIDHGGNPDIAVRNLTGQLQIDKSVHHGRHAPLGVARAAAEEPAVSDFGAERVNRHSLYPNRIPVSFENDPAVPITTGQNRNYV